MLNIEIDNGSGFCFGVTTAIQKAEEELAKGNQLYCLGDIVHNGMECERLREMGLITINHDEMAQLHNAKVLLRAHGEPPETYELARRNNIEIIDATCPVVLQLQKRIRKNGCRRSSPFWKFPRRCYATFAFLDSGSCRRDAWHKAGWINNCYNSVWRQLMSWSRRRERKFRKKCP